MHAVRAVTSMPVFGADASARSRSTNKLNVPNKARKNWPKTTETGWFGPFAFRTPFRRTTSVSAYFMSFLLLLSLAGNILTPAM